MGIYILVIVLSKSAAVGVTTQEFNSLESCQNAMSSILTDVDKYNSSLTPTLTCIKK